MAAVKVACTLFLAIVSHADGYGGVETGSKMSLALSMALHVATTNQRGIGLFSLAMNKQHFIQRLLAMRTGIDLHLIRTGWITEEERTLLTATARTLSKAHLWIDDRADLSLKELR